MSAPHQRSARLEAVIFDVNETLTDLSPLRDAFVRVGLGTSALRWWFAVVLRDGFALSAVGDTASFGELAATSLDEVAHDSGRELSEGETDVVMDAFAAVPLHSDVAPALERLRNSGVGAYALTNGSSAFARQRLDAGGVLPLFTEVVSVESVGHWKPRLEPYLYALEVIGRPAAPVALVAAHPWDLHGASSVGLVTGWVNRDARRYPSVFRAPQAQAQDLVTLVDSLLALAEE